jgi:hypothetical protein
VPRVTSTPVEIAAAKQAIADGNRDVAATVDVFHDGDFLLEMPEVVGVVALAQRLARRIQTSRGFFPWWPNEGLNISDYLLSRTPTWQIANQIKEEIKRDQQVADAHVRATLSADGSQLRVEIFVVSEVGPFVFTMTATEASSQLLDIRAAA